MERRSDGTYQWNPALVLRAGLSYDQTPVPDPVHRDARLPDASRYGVSIGAGYKLTDATSIDVAYAHLFGGSVGLDVTSSTGDRLVGTTRLSADILAFQLNVRY